MRENANQSFSKIFGSITNSVGFWVSFVLSAADVEQFQEKVFVVGVSVCVSAKGFDFLVDSFCFAV